MVSTEGSWGIAVPKEYPSRGRGIESKRKGRHGSPMRLKMRLKSLAAGYARRKDRRGKPQAPAASDISKSKSQGETVPDRSVARAPGLPRRESSRRMSA